MKNILANTGQLVEEGTWSKVFMAELASVLFYIFTVVSAVAVIYAIYLAFNLAKAQDEAARSKAKNRIHHAVASLLIIVILTTGLFAVGFTEAVFKNVQDTNRYKMSSCNFALSEVSVTFGKEGRVYLLQNGKQLTEDVEFKVITEKTEPGIVINLTSGGKVTAVTDGTLTFDAFYKGKLKLGNQVITVMDKVIIPPDDGDPPDGGQPGEDTKPVAQNNSFQNPVDYLSVGEEYDKYYGSNELPYIKTAFGSELPAAESPKDAAKDGFDPYVFYDHYTGTVFHNMGSVVNRRNIYASRIGEVVEVVNDVHDDSHGREYGWGNYITIRHELTDEYKSDLMTVDLKSGCAVVTTEKTKEIYSRYCNLAYGSIEVKKGDIVGGKAGDTFEGKETKKPYGQAIAKMGKTGFTTLEDSPQLYFEVWMKDVATGSWYIPDENKKKYNIYVDPFEGKKTYFVSHKSLKNATAVGKKKNKLWVNVEAEYQEFNNGTSDEEWQKWTEDPPENENRGMEDLSNAISQAFQEAVEGLSEKLTGAMEQVLEEMQAELNAIMARLQGAMDSLTANFTVTFEAELGGLRTALDARMSDIMKGVSDVVFGHISMEDILGAMIIALIQAFVDTHASTSTKVKLEYDANDNSISEVIIVSLSGNTTHYIDDKGDDIPENDEMVKFGDDVKKIIELNETELHGVINVLIDKIRAGFADELFAECASNPQSDYYGISKPTDQQKEDFYDEYEDEIESMLEAYLSELENTVTGGAGYTGANPTASPIDRLAAANNIEQLQDAAVAMIDKLEGSEPSWTVTEITSVEEKHSFWKKLLKKVLAGIAILAGAVLSVVSGGALLGVVALTLMEGLLISGAAAAVGAGALFGAFYANEIPDKLILHRNGGEGTSIYKLAHSKDADDIEFRNKVIAYYLKKIGDDGSLAMGRAVEETIAPNMADMNDDIETYMEGEMDALITDIGDIVSDLGDSVQNFIGNELQVIMDDINNLIGDLTSRLDDKIEEALDDVLSETLDELTVEINIILAETLLNEITDMIFSELDIGLGSTISLVFPPAPQSWYQYVERGIQIDAVEAVKAYFGLGSYTDVVSAVVRNVPYMDMYKVGSSSAPDENAA